MRNNGNTNHDRVYIGNLNFIHAALYHCAWRCFVGDEMRPYTRKSKPIPTGWDDHKSIRLNIAFPHDVWKWLVEECEESKKSVASIVRECVEEKMR